MPVERPGFPIVPLTGVSGAPAPFPGPPPSRSPSPAPPPPAALAGIVAVIAGAAVVVRAEKFVSERRQVVERCLFRPVGTGARPALLFRGRLRRGLPPGPALGRWPGLPPAGAPALTGFGVRGVHLGQLPGGLDGRYGFAAPQPRRYTARRIADDALAPGVLSALIRLNAPRRLSTRTSGVTRGP